MFRAIVLMTLCSMIPLTTYAQPALVNSEGTINTTVHDDPILTQSILLALKTAVAIKPGMTRANLSPSFGMDGGFSGLGTYLYLACPYIKIDVRFRHVRARGQGHVMSMEDTIISVSKPYLDFPRLD
jgi:hypothetical protein